MDASIYQLNTLCAEVKFVFPWPESTHPLLINPQADTRWHIDRGFVTGFFDGIFIAQNKFFFIDWKTDSLACGAEATQNQEVCEAATEERYSIQIL